VVIYAAQLVGRDRRHRGRKLGTTGNQGRAVRNQIPNTPISLPLSPSGSFSGSLSRGANFCRAKLQLLSRVGRRAERAWTALEGSQARLSGTDGVRVGCRVTPVSPRSERMFCVYVRSRIPSTNWGEGEGSNVGRMSERELREYEIKEKSKQNKEKMKEKKENAAEQE